MTYRIARPKHFATAAALRAWLKRNAASPFASFRRLRKPNARVNSAARNLTADILWTM
jgi:hypothetical protein